VSLWKRLGKMVVFYMWRYFAREVYKVLFSRR
jgi:hypothetical protein